MRPSPWLAVFFAIAVLLPTVARADVPEAPKVSTFAPAKDLAGQVPKYLEDLTEAVATEQDYNDGKEKLAKDANTLIVIVLALGMHDEANDYKAAAPALIEAAQQLAAARDYAAAKAGVEAVEKAATSKDGGDLKWEKAAVLRELMLAVPTINTKLKRYIRGTRFKRMANESAGCAAVLAAIAQASLPHVGDTTLPNESARWYKECEEMRAAAAEVNAAIRAGDQAATTKAIERLNKSCESCHEVFKPDAKMPDEEE
ncbi:MAG: cytochrome c [Pirellulales bacterium]|nr:cytochrome c [Pirellulales bacterium]